MRVAGYHANLRLSAKQFKCKPINYTPTWRKNMLQQAVKPKNLD